MILPREAGLLLDLLDAFSFRWRLPISPLHARSAAASAAPPRALVRAHGSPAARQVRSSSWSPLRYDFHDWRAAIACCKDSCSTMCAHARVDSNPLNLAKVY